MNKSDDNSNRLPALLDAGQVKEAFALFMEEVSDRPFPQLSTSELVALDAVCQRLLPLLLEDHVSWLVHHPDLVRRMLGLLTGALEAGYSVASTVDHVAWLRCLLAVSEAVRGRIERVHAELCLAGNMSAQTVPQPNGVFREQVQGIELAEKTPLGFLEMFFRACIEFLKRVGQYEMANHLDNRIGKILALIARDERRPGVARALFYDESRATGHSAFVHVKTTQYAGANGKASSTGSIEYAHRQHDQIDAAMLDAAVLAQQTVDAYLKRTGLPDGLDERLIHWEIGTVQGDTTKLERQFRGGSIALPLAVAVVSQYLAKPVPNDIALAGAFNIASVGSGRLPDAIKDAAVGFIQILDPTKRFPDSAVTKFTHHRYRTHIIACSLLTAGLVFLESWRVHWVLAADHAVLTAWTRIVTATVLVFAAMCFSLALPVACLRHKKSWSWYVGAGILAVCFVVVAISRIRRSLS